MKQSLMIMHISLSRSGKHFYHSMTVSPVWKIKERHRNSGEMSNFLKSKAVSREAIESTIGLSRSKIDMKK